MRPVPAHIHSTEGGARLSSWQPLLVAALGWVLGGGIAAADDARDWLAKTDAALTTRNYVGIFVHEHAGETETLRVIHRVASDGVSERLLSMDGSGREFIRRGTQLTAYLPDQRTVLVEKSPDAGLVFGSLPRVDTGSANEYDVQELSSTRVSGRAARVIAITPLDALRYGYRIWIDEATSMPLKTQLRNAQGSVLEQIVFTDLRLPSHIPDSELEPGVDAHAFRWVQRDAASADAHDGLSVSWQASSLPPGFRLTASTHQMLPGGPVEHLVFSDGLASVSVFIDLSHGVRAGETREDAARLTSSSAYSTVVQGFRVTAVGEVPPDTVRVIAQSMHAATTEVAVHDPATPGRALSPVLSGHSSLFDAPGGNGGNGGNGGGPGNHGGGNDPAGFSASMGLASHDGGNAMPASPGVNAVGGMGMGGGIGGFGGPMSGSMSGGGGHGGGGRH